MQMQQRCFVARRPELGHLLCKSVSLGRNDFPSGNQARLKAFGRKTAWRCDATKSSAADAEEAVQPKLPISRPPCRVFSTQTRKRLRILKPACPLAIVHHPTPGVAAH